jgi:hypothetical protein
MSNDENLDIMWTNILRMYFSWKFGWNMIYSTSSTNLSWSYVLKKKKKGYMW